MPPGRAGRRIVEGECPCHAACSERGRARNKRCGRSHFLGAVFASFEQAMGAIGMRWLRQYHLRTLLLGIIPLCLMATCAGKSVRYRAAADYHRAQVNEHYTQAKRLAVVPQRCPSQLWQETRQHQALVAAYDVLTFRPWGDLDTILDELHMPTRNGERKPG